MYKQAERITEPHSFSLWLKDSTFLEKLFIILSALIILSSFGPKLLNIGGAFVVEVFFIALFLFVLFFQPELNREVKLGLQLPLLIIGTVILYSLMIVGTLVGGDFLSAYSDFRASLITFCTFIFFLYSKEENEKKINVLFCLAFLSAFFSILYPLLFENSSSKTGYPIFSVVVLMYLAYIRNHLFIMLLSSILAIYMAVTGFYRSYWILLGSSVIIFNLLLLLKLKVFLSKKGFYYSAMLLVATLLIGVYFQSGAVVHYLSSSESRYIQSIGKWEDLTNFFLSNQALSESDSLRVSYYKYILLNWYHLILPHGFGYEAVFQNIDEYFNSFSIAANTIDSALLYMVYHFGIGLTAVFLAFIVRRFFIKLLTKKQFYYDNMAVLFGLFLIGFYGFVSGDVFTVIQKGFFYGAFLGLILNKSIKS